MHSNQDCNHYKSVIMKANATLNYLTAHNVKPSVQRMAVMEYLLDHRTHPTADEIYLALHRKMPTLSKTTVYNTLKILTGKGLPYSSPLTRRIAASMLTLRPTHTSSAQDVERFTIWYSTTNTLRAMLLFLMAFNLKKFSSTSEVAAKSAQKSKTTKKQRPKRSNLKETRTLTHNLLKTFTHYEEEIYLYRLRLCI